MKVFLGCYKMFCQILFVVFEDDVVSYFFLINILDNIFRLNEYFFFNEEYNLVEFFVCICFCFKCIIVKVQEMFKGKQRCLMLMKIVLKDLI